MNYYVKFNKHNKRNQRNREQFILSLRTPTPSFMQREIIISWMHFKVVHGKMSQYQKASVPKGRQYYFQLYRRNWGTNIGVLQTFLLFNLCRAKPGPCISNIHLSLVVSVFFLLNLLLYTKYNFYTKFKMWILKKKEPQVPFVWSAQKRLLLTSLILQAWVAGLLQNPNLKTCMIIVLMQS